MNGAASIAPRLVAEGDPQALADLCRWRGGAVYAYCSQVASGEDAMNAAADAFADFRVAVIASAGLSAGEAESLLRQKTRRAAARRGINAMAASTGRQLVSTCEGREIRLVRYAEKALSSALQNVFAEHIATCGTCAAAVRRLEAGELAFDRPPRAPLPRRVIDEILLALTVAAPVRAFDGDDALVQDEALRLLTASSADPAGGADASTSAGGHVDSPPDLSLSVPARAAIDPPPNNQSAGKGVDERRAGARARAGAGATDRGGAQRLNPVAWWRRRHELLDLRPRRIRRGAVSGAVFAGAAGAAFGIGLVMLTDDNSISSRPGSGIGHVAAAATARGATAATSAANAPQAGGRDRGKLRIEVLATVVHPLEGAPPAARVSVHLRITNAMGRRARARRPVLHVGDARVELAAVSTGAAMSPIASLDPGSVAEGRLRFDAEQPVADMLTTVPVRLRISGRSVPLTPVVASAQPPP